MSVREYFKQLNEMPIEELLVYLNGIGIETQKIDNDAEFNVFKEMNLKAYVINPLILTSVQDIDESFDLNDCYEVAA